MCSARCTFQLNTYRRYTLVQLPTWYTFIDVAFLNLIDMSALIINDWFAKCMPTFVIVDESPCFSWDVVHCSVPTSVTRFSFLLFLLSSEGSWLDSSRLNRQVGRTPQSKYAGRSLILLLCSLGASCSKRSCFNLQRKNRIKLKFWNSVNHR